MYYYVKTRKKGTSEWKALREDGRIIVFSNIETAKKYGANIENSVFKIISLLHHPSHKQSQIHARKFKKIGW